VGGKQNERGGQCGDSLTLTPHDSTIKRRGFGAFGECKPGC